jgi:hypothetical protein
MHEKIPATSFQLLGVRAKKPGIIASTSLGCLGVMRDV